MSRHHPMLQVLSAGRKVQEKENMRNELQIIQALAMVNQGGIKPI